MSSQQKFIFVTGGVCSGLGKGISAASIGLLLSKMGYRVFAQKLDPYLNFDPGTMNPIEHGEVFVTDDGGETDLDLGHYERFLDTPLFSASSVSSGQIYQDILSRERRGDFLGKTVQIIPHITDAIKERVRRAAKKSGAEVILVEIGGTVGDIEGEAFFEAARQLIREEGRENCLSVHVSFLPYLKASRELKSKPMQNSIRELRRIGLEADIIIARSDYHIPISIVEKIATFAALEVGAIVPAQTAKSIYEVPLDFEKYGVARTVCDKLSLAYKRPDVELWRKFVVKMSVAQEVLKIGIAGKYLGLQDAYYSVMESLRIAGVYVDRKIELVWIDTEVLVEGSERQRVIELAKLDSVQGVVVPGGFGGRGVKGMVQVAHFARKNALPYLGLCLGSQVIGIDLAQEFIDRGANSEEFDEKTPCPVIHMMKSQENVREKGGTMRLGSYECILDQGSQSYVLYGTDQIWERHRHRFEFNNKYRKELEASGLRIAGTSPDGSLTEVVEIVDHPFMIGSQFHPEFLSRPEMPHPLFMGFLQVCIK